MSKRNEHLIEEYYLRDLNPEELSDLQDLLAADQELQKRFVDAGRDEWLMHDAYHANAAEIVHFKPRHRKQSRIRAIAAGITLVISFGLYLTTRQNEPPETVVVTPGPAAVATISDIYILEGEAISVVNKGKIRKLDAACELHDGDSVVVPEGCRLSYQYLNEETHIEIGSGSLFKLTGHDSGKTITLRQGRLRADVAEQVKDKPMRIVTSDAEAVVLGTVFEVAARDITRLSVVKGKVRFKPVASDDSVVVTSGFTAEATQERLNYQPFKTVEFYPTNDRTLNYGKYPDFIAIDPDRDYFGFLTFELGEIDGEIEEAMLTLRVMHHQQDYGGSGEVRLFRVHPESPLSGERVQLAHYSGKVGGGMNLEFDIDPSKLSDGVNAMMIALDEGGNDFWFSSSRGAMSPSLRLKIVKEKE